MSGNLFGYARVSTEDQNLDVQIGDLKSAGVPDGLIFSEKKSGTSREGREELNRLLTLLRAGDILCVTRIDRLARSMVDFSNIVHDLKARGIGLRVIKQSIDTSVGGPVGDLTMNLLAAFSAFETQIRRERQMEGIAKAKSKGVYIGGKKKYDEGEIYRLYHEEKVAPSEIQRRFNCSPSTVFRAIKH